MKSGRDGDDSLLSTIGPISDAPTRVPPRGSLIPFALVHSPGPYCLAGPPIRGDNRPAAAGSKVEHAVHHQRRGFALVFRLRPEIVGLPRPCDFEILHIVSIDLIERRITRAAFFTAINSPLSILGAKLRDERKRA